MAMPSETDLLRALLMRMKWRSTDHVEADFGPSGRLAVHFIPAAGVEPDEDSQPFDALCPCGPSMETDHALGGCLHGCSDSRCSKRETISQLEREVFGRIFARQVPK